MKKTVKKIEIRVVVRTNATVDSLEDSGDGRFKITVREKPEGNRANERILELVARHFSVPLQAVRLVSGHHRTGKRISIIKHS